MTKQELINIWHEFYANLAQGQPPLGLLLLGFNGLALFLWLSRQDSKRRALRSEIAILNQLLFLGGNLMLIFMDDITRYAPHLIRLI
jgi:hypothetical protein